MHEARRMKWSEFALPLCLSGVLHLGLLWHMGSYSAAQIAFEHGKSAVALTILPSVAARQSVPLRDTDAPRPPASDFTIAQDAEPYFPVGDVRLLDRRSDISPIVPHEEEIASPETIVREVIGKLKPSDDLLAERLELPKSKAEAPDSSAERVPAKPEVPLASVGSLDSPGDLEEKGVLVPSEVAHLDRPEYPFYCRRHGQEGTVVLTVEIGHDGKPERITMGESSGYPRLNSAAIEAVKKARFTPARRGGVPVSSHKRIAFTFKLTEAAGL